MATPRIDVPLSFTTGNPLELKTQLERMARSLDGFVRGLAEAYVPRYVPVPVLNPSNLAFGQVARVSLIDGDELRMQLPPADRINYGKRCAVLRTTVAGVVKIWPVGKNAKGSSSLVAGLEAYQMGNDIHFVEFLLDDGNWYPTRPGGGFAAP